jgi:hypothetical protein
VFAEARNTPKTKTPKHPHQNIQNPKGLIGFSQADQLFLIGLYLYRFTCNNAWYSLV